MHIRRLSFCRPFFRFINFLYPGIYCDTDVVWGYVGIRMSFLRSTGRCTLSNTRNFSAFTTSCFA
ncbi:hypothetical protein BDR03DRAFT_963952 [Suillus americanus]|nr:hypothetical protein BDR03DRAFT_963952 [Suillus americanus]